MTDRAAEIIKALDLMPHPEGGYFKETYRSDLLLIKEALPEKFSGSRSCCTGIYFLLEGRNKSRFHRIKSDEMWHHYEGSVILIHILDASGSYSKIRLGKGFSGGEVQQAVVPAGAWFAAEVEGGTGYCLAGCTVAPGFDFEDFELADGKSLTELFPSHRKIIETLT